jgi:hypothetical protein
MTSLVMKNQILEEEQKVVVIDALFKDKHLEIQGKNKGTHGNINPKEFKMEYNTIESAAFNNNNELTITMRDGSFFIISGLDEDEDLKLKFSTGFEKQGILLSKKKRSFN